MRDEKIGNCMIELESDNRQMDLAVWKAATLIIQDLGRCEIYLFTQCKLIGTQLSNISEPQLTRSIFHD